MNLIVRAFPLREDGREALESFRRELRAERAAETAGFYRRFGVARETWHVQETDDGPWVICVTQVPERSVTEVATEYGASEEAFDAWFKRRVESLTGVDPNRDPLGPPTECVFDTLDLDA